MNPLKKGPEIKLSEIRVPGFLQDLYYDLKDRHLLPLAVILLLAIIVVPFALSKSSDGGEASEDAGTVAVTAGASNAPGSSELVAKSAPGLRDYKRRLEHLTSKNPFHQQYRRGEPEEETGGSTVEAGETTVSPETTETYEEFESGSPGNGSPESGGGDESHGELTYYSYVIDVRVTTGIGGGEEDQASSGQGKTTVRHDLPQATALPSRETPAIIFMGAAKGGKKALMLVSSDVQAIFGDAKCALGTESCQLLAMEPGLPETFVYGKAGKTFKIELLKLHLVESKHLNRAPLGKSHPNGVKPQPHGERLTIVGAAKRRSP